jgi:hypothetical protein
MAKTYATMHSIAADNARIWDNRLGIPVVLLGTLTSASIFTTDPEADPNDIWRYINGAMVLAMTAITGVSKHIGLSQAISDHTKASLKYITLSMEIDTLLSFPRSDRLEDPRAFIDKAKMTILDIKGNVSKVPTSIVKSFIKNLDKGLVDHATKVNRHRTAVGSSNNPSDRSGDMSDEAIDCKDVFDSTNINPIELQSHVSTLFIPEADRLAPLRGTRSDRICSNFSETKFPVEMDAHSSMKILERIDNESDSESVDDI